MRSRLSLFLLALILLTHFSQAQIVGTNVYIKGAYVEIGMISDGAFGAPAPPVGYHPHFGSLAEVYDYGHDGWAVGTPPFMGDYTYPGYPFEGWEVQWNGTARVQGYQSGYAFTGGATMTGSGITSYTNSLGRAIANWSGTTGGGNLLMKSTTRVDTYASAVVVTVYFYNTSATVSIPSVYYWRSCDPDNDETWPGGGFFTNNYVNFQNSTVPNPTHKVEVTGIGQSSTLPPFTLGTKDCRAVACIYNSWPLTISQDLAAIWNQTYGGAFYNVGVNHPGDIGFGIVWNLGTILPKDSTVISYAYIFNGPGGIDDPGALPDPKLVVNNVVVSSFPDTFDACTLPTGIDTLPVDVLYGADKDWTWSRWTWAASPGTGGLSTTTGTHVVINTSLLSGPTTYTVTGTDSATGMKSCNTKVFIFTVRPCHFAFANAPCEGDTLHLSMTGDTVGASYFWFGPHGFTSPSRTPYIYPCTLADTGMYHVIKYVGSLHDTDFVHVVIHPLPHPNPTSNVPNACDPLVDPLTLTSTLDSAGETFLWTGPAGFTSTLQNPTVPGFDSSMQGVYVVTGTTIWGCKTTQSTSVIPGITPAFDFSIGYGCDWDTVRFFNHTKNANSYQWIFDDPTPDATTREAYHVYKASNRIWHVTLNLKNAANCVASIAHDVDARHEIHAKFAATPDTICLNNGALVSFLDSAYAFDSSFRNTSSNPPYIVPSSYSWSFGDGGTDNSTSPSHTFVKPGIFGVTQTVTDAMGCRDSVTHPVYVVQINIKSFHDTLLCISQPLALVNTVTSIPDGKWGYSFSWSESSPNLDHNDIQVPSLFSLGTFTDILTVTIPGVVPDGCPSMDTIVIHSVKGKKLDHLTAEATIDYGDKIQLHASNEVIYYWMPNDGSLDNNNINNPIATPKQTTTYTVFGYDINGCLDSADIVIHVDTTMNQDVPSAFTPNGDGNNDVFKPVGIKFQYMVEFRVYNRWGQEMFYTNNKEIGWDGTFHGVPQDLGVYNYLIRVAKPGQDNVVYKGNVTLIR